MNLHPCNRNEKRNHRFQAVTAQPAKYEDIAATPEEKLRLNGYIIPGKKEKHSAFTECLWWSIGESNP